MMTGFKFLNYKKPIFQFEITNHIEWYPASLMGIDTWSGRYPELVKEWLSDFFFGQHPNGFNHEKYVPEIDRTLKLIQTGLNSTPFGERLFTAIVQIKRDSACYMEVHLEYPISCIIYQ